MIDWIFFSWIATRFRSSWIFFSHWSQLEKVEDALKDRMLNRGTWNVFKFMEHKLEQISSRSAQHCVYHDFWHSDKSRYILWRPNSSRIPLTSVRAAMIFLPCILCASSILITSIRICIVVDMMETTQIPMNTLNKTQLQDSTDCLQLRTYCRLLSLQSLQWSVYDPITRDSSYCSW